MTKLFLDMDGVLADFDERATHILGMPPSEYEEKHGSTAFWDRIYANQNFYYNLKPMADAVELLRYTYPYRPIILTGKPRGDWATLDKLKWVRDKLPSPYCYTPVIVCLSKDKVLYSRAGDILVDDRTQYKDVWERAEGIFIHHKNSVETIAELDWLRGTGKLW